ncbi:MAG: right-handed parallel beta-helix repeat-containing protein [Gemmatimonadota bacterium]
MDYTLITECGTVISQPGKYRLEKDIICGSFWPEGLVDALRIEANHVVVDFNGHHIAEGSSNSVGNGIRIGGFEDWISVTDVTLRGPGFVEGFQTDGIIVYNGSNHVTITKLIIQGNVDNGIIVGGSDVTVHDNVIRGSEYCGVEGWGSSMRFLYNHIGPEGAAPGRPLDCGIHIFGSETAGATGVEVRGNQIDAATGLSMEADGGLVTSNQIHGSSIALWIRGHGNRIVANKFSNDGFDPPHVTPADIVDDSGCGANFYKENWFTTALPACVQVPRTGL